MTNKELIRSVLKDITIKVNTENAKEGNLSLSEKRQEILVLFTGSKSNLDDILDNLKRIKEKGYSLTLCFSKNAELLLDIRKIERLIGTKKIYLEENKNQYIDIVNSTDLTLVPLLTQNTLAKVATGIHDNLITMLLWQLLWSGKRVIVNPNSALNNNDIQCGNKKMANLIKAYIQKIKDFGAEIIYDHDYLKYIFKYSNNESKTFIKENDRSKKEVITQKSVLNLIGKTNRLEVIKGSIITDLAKDTAKEKGIEIIYL